MATIEMYLAKVHEARRLESELEGMMPCAIFRTFCAACLVADNDEVHQKEEGVSFAYKCVRGGAGRPKKHLERGFTQINPKSHGIFFA